MGTTDETMNLPGSDILFARLAQRLMESGEVEEATKICEKGLRKYPTYAQAHYILARCYMNQHMTDEARIELERVLRYDPNHVNAIKDLSSIYFINGFQDLYREYLMKLYVLCPLNEEIIDEVRKLGDFDHWSATPLEDEKPKIRPPDKDRQIDRGEKEQPPERKSQVPVIDDDNLFPEKVDLSQFDNLQDDFTTILHGNIDLPVRKPPFTSAGTSPDFNGDEIFADVSDEVKDQNGEGEEETMTELLDDDEELVASNQQKTSLPDEKKQDPEILIRQGSKKPEEEKADSEGGKETGNEKADPKEAEQTEKTAPPDETIEVREMPARETKSPSPPVSDFDHLQDDEETHFEQPKIISQTLGEILVSQKKYAEAKSVFEALKEKHPENKSIDAKISFLEKIIELDKGSKS